MFFNNKQEPQNSNQSRNRQKYWNILYLIQVEQIDQQKKNKSQKKNRKTTAKYKRLSDVTDLQNWEYNSQRWTETERLKKGEKEI